MLLAPAYESSSSGCRTVFAERLCSMTLFNDLVKKYRVVRRHWDLCWLLWRSACVTQSAWPSLVSFPHLCSVPVIRGVLGGDGASQYDVVHGVLHVVQLHIAGLCLLSARISSAAALCHRHWWGAQLYGSTTELILSERRLWKFWNIFGLMCWNISTLYTNSCFRFSMGVTMALE